jgi:hypothetical protein
MLQNRSFKDINEALPKLANAVTSLGSTVGSRAGRTKELTFQGVTLLEPRNREILLPSRKASLPAQIAETMWVLSGRDDVEWLSHYLKRAKDFSDDGEVWRAAYGPRLRLGGTDPTVRSTSCRWWWTSSTPTPRRDRRSCRSGTRSSDWARARTSRATIGCTS